MYAITIFAVAMALALYLVKLNLASSINHPAGIVLYTHSLYVIDPECHGKTNPHSMYMSISVTTVDNKANPTLLNGPIQHLRMCVDYYRCMADDTKLIFSHQCGYMGLNHKRGIFIYCPFCIADYHDLQSKGEYRWCYERLKHREINLKEFYKCSDAAEKAIQPR